MTKFLRVGVAALALTLATTLVIGQARADDSKGHDTMFYGAGLLKCNEWNKNNNEVVISWILGNWSGLNYMQQFTKAAVQGVAETLTPKELVDLVMKRCDHYPSKEVESATYDVFFEHWDAELNKENGQSMGRSS
jgi:hypothetical protein